MPNLTALVAAGVFHGIANVLAKAASAVLGDDDHMEDIRWNYFTVCLVVSWIINLYFTKLGFVEPMVQFMELHGVLLGKID